MLKTFSAHPQHSHIFTRPTFQDQASCNGEEYGVRGFQNYGFRKGGEVQTGCNGSQQTETGNSFKTLKRWR